MSFSSASKSDTVRFSRNHPQCKSQPFYEFCFNIRIMILKSKRITYFKYSEYLKLYARTLTCAYWTASSCLTLFRCCCIHFLLCSHGLLKLLLLPTPGQRQDSVRHFGEAFAKLRKTTISCVMCVRVCACVCACMYVCMHAGMYVRPSNCPHGTTRLPLERFWWYFIFENFSKICWENSGIIKIG